MQPVYFLPDITAETLAPNDGRLDRSKLRARGIADVFADVVGIYQDCGIADVVGLGPGDKSGCVLFYQTTTGKVPRRAGYYPADQTWHPVGDGSLAWIGLDNASPPTAADFARKTQHSGYGITLADGAEWNIPIVRRPDGSTELPTDLYWDAAGRLQEPIKAAYAAYWESTKDVCEWFFESGFGDGFSKGRALELAVAAVGINYRYGRNEQNIVRAIDKETFINVLAWSVDMPRFNAVLAAEKKSE